MAKRDRVGNIFWMLFGAGGMIAAFLLPVHILLNNLMPVIGIGVDAANFAVVSSKLANPIVRLYFIIVFAGTVYHGLHRVRFLLLEAGLERYRRGLMVIEHILDAVIIGSGVYYILIAL